MSQHHYIESMLDRFNMSDCNPVRTPFPQGFEALPATDEEGQIAKEFRYREIVGSLLYLSTIARPDISHAIGTLCRSMSKWNSKHIAAAEHILRYVKGTNTLALTFKRSVNSDPMGFADADWAVDQSNSRSTTGYLFSSFGGLICWKSRLQPTVAMSTTEAEYIASSDATRQAIWLPNLLPDISFGQSLPLVIYNDNQGCIALIVNDPENHEETKHIRIRYHSLQEKVVEFKTISLVHIASENSLADLLTKYIPRDKFIQLRDGLHLQNLS